MIDKIPFGRTGHNSSRTLFGAAALGGVTQDEADSTLELLLSYGVNHIDTASSYGAAEDRIGPWLQTRRDDFFLATKTGERTYQKARDQIRHSLERLQITQIDLIQLHNLVDENEWRVAMGDESGEKGALAALIEARQEGLVRFIGVTGHGLEVAKRHQQSLARFDFDAVLLPLNFSMMQNPEYADDFNALHAMCRERDVAMQTIKSICRKPKNDDSPQRATWYEPLENPDDIQRAVHWVLGHEGIFLNTVGDIHVLPLVLEAAAENAEMPSDEEMEAMHETRAMEPLFA